MAAFFRIDCEGKCGYILGMKVCNHILMRVGFRNDINIAQVCGFLHWFKIQIQVSPWNKSNEGHSPLAFVVLCSTRYCGFVTFFFVRIQMRIRIPGSIPRSNGSGWGFSRPKHIRIRMRIRNNVKKSSKSKKTVEIKVSLTILLDDGRIGAGAGAGSVLVTDWSRCGSGRPKNIRIHNTASTLPHPTLSIIGN